MSNSTKPRALRLKKFPKGTFKWKVALRMSPGKRMDSYDRYYDNVFKLPEAVHVFLKENLSGKFDLHWVKNFKAGMKRRKGETHGYRKYDYILFENQFDVTMFKLCHGDLIRQIYKIEVE